MFKSLFTFTLFLPLFIFGNIVQAQTVSCTNLQYDLGIGNSNSSVTLLQEYLKSVGYFTATPTGYFGPATLSAVKTFQINNNISSTGYVGPLTRSTINQKSCNSTNTVTQTIIQPSTSATVPTTLINDITNPTVGQVLLIGNTITIQWNKNPAWNFNIILERPDGVGAGFVANNFSNINTNKYVWKVGNIYSSQTNTNKIIETGTYRLRLINTISGSSLNDIVSGWFTIIPSEFKVTSVVPTSAPADNATAIVLFGSGFNTYNNNSIYFDTNYSGIRANNLYTSPDGTVLVFTIPTSILAGSHILYVNSGINSNYKTIPFTVNSAQ